MVLNIMFQVAIVIFREFLEISILLGLFSAVARNIKDFKIYLTAGILLGCFGASIIAFFTDQISESLDGIGSEIFDASIILLTVAMICSTLIWMNNYGRQLKTTISNYKEGLETNTISRTMFVTLISTTMFREGSEIVLLLKSISTINHEQNYVYLIGFAIGSIAGILCGVAIYFGLFKFANKYIFAISNIFMTFIAAGLSADSARIFSSVGVINSFSSVVWDSSSIISDDSITGKFLKIAIGYSARPIGLEILFYLSTILIIVFFRKIFSGKKK